MNWTSGTGRMRPGSISARKRGRGDGVVIGYGTVGNRSVTLWAQDATCWAAPLAPFTREK